MKIDIVANVELFYREGSSDKVYKATMIKDPSGGYLVNFAYGRRGNTLTMGTKTTNPIGFDAAKKIYDKLVSEKTGKGYVEDVAGKPFAGTVTESRNTGQIPQLLNEIEESEVEKYITDDDWCAQEKYDGQNRTIIKSKGVITGVNKKGLSVTLPEEIEVEMQMLPMECILNGEIMGNYIMLWDDYSIPGKYAERYTTLKYVIGNDSQSVLRVVDTAWTTKEKRAMLKRLRNENAEGIVFKKIDSLYKPGRPNSGGDQLKFKFCASASCIVTGVSTTKRSIQVGVYDGLELVNIGSVTVYPNQEIPGMFDSKGRENIVEVKYLYAYKGGSLFQPVLLGIREDVSPEECVIGQLKYKRGEVEN